MTALLHPAEIKAIMAKGRHEVGLHGWIHERNSLLSEDDERTLMNKSFDTLKQISGKAPVGIRTPSWDFSASTLELVRELGLIYDSSLMLEKLIQHILSKKNVWFATHESVARYVKTQTN